MNYYCLCLLLDKMGLYPPPCPPAYGFPSTKHSTWHIEGAQLNIDWKNGWTVIHLSLKEWKNPREYASLSLPSMWCNHSIFVKVALPLPLYLQTGKWIWVGSSVRLITEDECPVGRSNIHLMNKSPEALNQSISQNLQLYPIYQAFFPVQFTPLGHCSLQLFLIYYILEKLTPQMCMFSSRPLGHTFPHHLDGSKSWKEFFC